MIGRRYGKELVVTNLFISRGVRSTALVFDLTVTNRASDRRSGKSDYGCQLNPLLPLAA